MTSIIPEPLLFWGFIVFITSLIGGGLASWIMIFFLKRTIKKLSKDISFEDVQTKSDRIKKEVEDARTKPRNSISGNQSKGTSINPSSEKQNNSFGGKTDIEGRDNIPSGDSGDSKLYSRTTEGTSDNNETDWPKFE